MYTANQEFSWAHGGVRVQTFARGERFTTDDPELIRVATEQGWIGNASAAGAPLMTIEQLLAAKADIDRAAADLAATQVQLEAQAEQLRGEADRQNAEAARQAEQADILAAERHRLEALAKQIEASKQEFAKTDGGPADPGAVPGAVIDPAKLADTATITAIDKPAKAKK